MKDSKKSEMLRIIRHLPIDHAGKGTEGRRRACCRVTGQHRRDNQRSEDAGALNGRKKKQEVEWDGETGEGLCINTWEF